MNEPAVPPKRDRARVIRLRAVWVAALVLGIACGLYANVFAKHHDTTIWLNLACVACFLVATVAGAGAGVWRRRKRETK